MTTVVDITARRRARDTECPTCAETRGVCAYHRGVTDGLLALADRLRATGATVDEDTVYALATGRTLVVRP